MSKRLLGLLITGCLLSFAWALTAQAQYPIHPYYSTSRAQIGNGLPLPITFTPPPRGKLAPVSGATAMQTSVITGGAITIPSAQLTAAPPPINLPLHPSNNNVFQVQTSGTGKFPGVGVTAMFAAASFTANGSVQLAGRTGPSTVTFCPGLPVPTATYNPSCSNPPIQVPSTAVNGLKGSLRYVKTLNQFGGTARGSAAGTATGGRGAVVALRNLPLGSLAPCTHTLLPTAAPTGTDAGCKVNFDFVVPFPTGVNGGTFGVTNMDAVGPGLVPGIFAAKINAGGTIVSMTSPGTGVGINNLATSHGAPWTTGMLTVSAFNTANLGTEMFILSGSDSANTAAGTRRISLVSGAVAQRTLSGPNANRGWLNLFLPEPGAVLGSVGALLALLGCHSLLRRRSR